MKYPSFNYGTKDKAYLRAFKSCADDIAKGLPITLIAFDGEDKTFLALGTEVARDLAVVLNALADRMDEEEKK